MKPIEIKYENPLVEQLEELINMVSCAFKYTGEDKINQDFPLLYEEKNISHLWIIHEKKNGKKYIASHAGSLQHELYIDGINIPVGGIGGVASKEDVRGKGYATALVTKCLEDLKASGAALAFLWSGEHDFYRSLGFELASRQWSIPLPLDKAEYLKSCAKKICDARGISYDSWKVSADRKIVLKQGKQLFDRHSLRIERDPSSYVKLLSLPGAQILSLTEGKNLIAYIVIGKGMDLKNHIHEWAGSEEGLLFLTAEALDLVKQNLILLTPQFTPAEAPWIYSLEKLGFKSDAGYMGLVKILNFEKIRETLIKKLKILAMEPSFLRLEKLEENKFCIGWATDPDIYLNENELLKVLFGPQLPSEQIDLADGSKNALDALLPLRLWWWGLDSV